MTEEADRDERLWWRRFRRLYLSLIFLGGYFFGGIATALSIPIAWQGAIGFILLAFVFWTPAHEREKP